MELALKTSDPLNEAGGQVKIKIREFITRNLLFNGGDYPLSDAASFLQHGVIDSLGVMELVSFAGHEFNIEVGAAEITPENFDSVDRLAAYIRRKLEGPVAPGGPCAG